MLILLLIKEQFLAKKIMSIALLPSELTSITKPRKLSKTEKEVRLKEQRDKLSDMVDLFYSKAKAKIQKALNKDNKKSSLLCKELIEQLSQYPKQQLFEISRLSDEFFNEMTKLNNYITDFLKSIESLRQKISKQLTIQKQRSSLKQEKEALGEYHIAMLRKINFKKQKTSLCQKLKQIDSLNKKIVKFEAHPEEDQYIGSIEIDGKKIQLLVYKYRKIHFQIKKREYLLCICKKKDSQEGYLTLFSDKLQMITSFNHLPPLSLRTFLDIIPIDGYLFIVYTHQVMRISLTNEMQTKSQVFRQKINKVDSLGGQLVLWVQDSHFNHSLIFMNSNLEIYYQEYLRINIKYIGLHFKFCAKDNHQLFFLGRTTNGTNDLFKIKNTHVELIAKDFGHVDQAVQYKCQGIVSCVLLRKGGELFKFTSEKMREKLIQIDLDNGDEMKKCCILGQHFYALHQSGKQMLECHFKLNLDEENPEP